MRLLLLLIAFLFFQFALFSQGTIDSVLILREQAAFRLTNTNPDSALKIAEIDLAQSLYAGKKREAAYCYKTKGWALFRLGNMDSCLANLNTSTSLFLQLNEKVETMYNYLNLANVYSTASRFKESAAFLIKADSMAQRSNDSKLQAGIKRQMGVLYREQGQLEKAIPYFKESMQQYLNIKDTLHVWDAGSGLSTTYIKLNWNDSNIALLNRCASLLKAVKGANYQKAMLDEKFGDAYYAVASFNKALDYYKGAYNIFTEDNNSSDMAYEAINVGKTYKEAKRYAEAEKSLLRAYQLSDSTQMLHYAHDAAHELSNLYKATGDWQNGFKWLAITNKLNDSLNLNEQNEKTAELQAKYEAEKKDKEISLLRKDAELNRLTIQKQKTFKYGTVIVIALLALIAFLVVNRYRAVHKAQQQVEIEKLRNNIARDLHDDMGSVLSSINIISKVVLDNPAEKENMQEHFKKINENSNYMLESMSDIVWAINPANDSLIKVVFKMKEFAGDILDPLNIQWEFLQSGNFENIQLSLKSRKDIYLVYKEAINNAAKYSRCSKVTINLSHQSNEIILQVVDNGVGFDTNIIKEGNGLKNIKQRAAEMNGSASIISAPGQGTTVLVSIKSHE
jgi:two-component system sensor histidine kinase UhpB